MGRRTRTQAAADPPRLPALEPCAKCGLRLGPGGTPTGRALHDCREVQKLRRLADERRKESSLEIEVEEYLRRKIEENDLQAQDAARVLVVLRKNRVEAGGGPTDALLLMLRD